MAMRSWVFGEVNLDSFIGEVVAGADSATSIAVANITTNDKLLFVWHEDGTSGVTQNNLVSEASVTAAGYIELSSTDTTNDKLIVVWFDVSQAAA